MARVGIFAETPEKWFVYEDDTEILIRYLSKDAMGDVVKKAESASKKLGINSSKLYDVFLARKAVLGWRSKNNPDETGLTLPDGSPFSYSDENRDKVAAQDRYFSSFVLKTAADASAFMDEVTLDDVVDFDIAGLDALVRETDSKN